MKKSVRQQCVERDGDCIVESAFWGSRGWQRFNDETVNINGFTEYCEGPPQWCHMHSRRRSKTRGLLPEARHDTAHSFIACQKHHDHYDGRRTPRLFVTALTAKGANGPLKFRMGR